MGIGIDELFDFFAAQVAKQQKWFQVQHADKFLCYMGSTSAPGAFLRVTAHRLRGIERGATPTELVVRLAGGVGPMASSEIVTVTVFNQFVGYQVKTRAGSAAPAVQGDGAATAVRGAQVFTLHHSPFMLTAFEKVPVEEVIASVGRARFALAGAGVAANLSPRFCWHTEVVEGKVVLYHGDGLPMKTFLNLRTNPNVTRIAIDPETFQGYVATGRAEEFRPAAHPEAYDRICAGFTNGGWGKPARVFRFVAERWDRLAPQE
ncbi:MAG TPA: hypothetical protein VLU43_17355 [Anaeromyxobacteraceae bacterium]|nr:hypothetical protein [Anaeromyxobacteraceae bacterium]